jgi:ABC-type nickel/cobalt efflux system permease component RcnA
MVGPTTREERRTASRRLKLGFILLVGVSGGLITSQGDVSIVVSLLAVLVGLVVGVVMVALAFPSGLRGS